TVSKGFTFLGLLKRCPLCYTCRCFCSSPDWLFICSTSTILCSVWLFGGSGLLEVYMDASR
ncbi:hypothetical protein BGW80DRAFT_1315857, partial [Lactifluus volemus]